MAKKNYISDLQSAISFPFSTRDAKPNGFSDRKMILNILPLFSVPIEKNTVTLSSTSCTPSVLEVRPSRSTSPFPLPTLSIPVTTTSCVPCSASTPLVSFVSRVGLIWLEHWMKNGGLIPCKLLSISFNRFLRHVHAHDGPAQALPRPCQGQEVRVNIHCSHLANILHFASPQPSMNKHKME